ncbi:small RNA 2'-O-methyltransferase [Leucoraja erinacea]|uniref:small RNA 2'-O-methyltransferase n=1 Tax=Leucoraja erinaceus TaxID=7782 RepID=UPI0024542E8A|nr:small RNA 2'-O-methyltransferase [Leucoraja erinacea]
MSLRRILHGIILQLRHCCWCHQAEAMETITFSPPLYKQRYQLVVELVEKLQARKVADLGCARCTLLSRLKFCSCIEVLIGVDTDLELLKENMYRVSPLPGDYLQPRPSPLSVRLYQGSVAVKDPRMLDCDFVSCIELIEHLDAAELARFSEVLFGYMNPAVVVITTPNADFNILFPGVTQFRHCDHRFEWSRSEFQAWCLDIGRTNAYSMEFTGVGVGPAGTETLGFCTQVAIFRRDPSRAKIKMKNSELPYKLVYEAVYPSLQNRKILHDAILNEVIFAAECVRRSFIDIDTGGQSEWRTCRADGEECARAAFSPEVSGPSFGGSPEVAGCPELSWSPEVTKIGAQLHIPVSTFFNNPRIRQLSDSLQQLQEVLQASNRVKLSHCGSSVLYPAGDEN